MPYSAHKVGERRVSNLSKIRFRRNVTAGMILWITERPKGVSKEVDAMHMREILETRDHVEDNHTRIRIAQHTRYLPGK